MRCRCEGWPAGPRADGRGCLAHPASSSALTVSVGSSPAGAIVATDGASLDDDIGLGNIGGQVQVAGLAGLSGGPGRERLIGGGGHGTCIGGAGILKPIGCEVNR